MAQYPPFAGWYKLMQMKSYFNFRRKYLLPCLFAQKSGSLGNILRNVLQAYAGRKIRNAAVGSKFTEPARHLIRRTNRQSILDYYNIFRSKKDFI